MSFDVSSNEEPYEGKPHVRFCEGELLYIAWLSAVKTLSDERDREPSEFT